MLELTIIDGIRPDNPTIKTKIFNANGGSIGRDANCTWVLMDRQRVVSSEHAKIIFREGAYYLSDISTNGVFNGSGQAVGRGELRKLTRGDIYIIGPYRIEVSEIKLGDPADSLREAGLQHLLMEEDAQADEWRLYTPHPSPLPQGERGKKSAFSQEQAPNTLKAYDFMPEPIDLLLKSEAPAKTPNPCIPEDVFAKLQPEVKETSEVAVSLSPAPVTENLPVALSGVDFLRELCQAFNLDYRLLGTQTQSELHQKIIALIQGVLSLLLELKAIEKTLMKNFDISCNENSGLHNPFQVAVSQRQLFELIMRDDPEFMNPKAALSEMRQLFLPRLQQVLVNIPQAQRKLLTTLAPEAMMPKAMSKFNLLQDKHAWQAYQQHYQNLAADNARGWLEQFNNLIKEKV